MLDKSRRLWYNNYRKKEVDTMIRKLDWMTEEQFKELGIFWGLVCDYEKVWQDDDYENWCKRVLKVN